MFCVVKRDHLYAFEVGVSKVGGGLGGWGKLTVISSALFHRSAQHYDSCNIQFVSLYFHFGSMLEECLQFDSTKHRSIFPGTPVSSRSK